MTKISVFGMGSFGTALANVLAQNGHDVLMWGKNDENVEELNTHHMNKNYLKEAKLDPSIKASTDLSKVVDFADIYLMALPTKAMREVASKIDGLLTTKRLLFMLQKVLKMVRSNVYLKCWKIQSLLNTMQVLVYYQDQVTLKKLLSNNLQLWQHHQKMKQ